MAVHLFLAVALFVNMFSATAFATTNTSAGISQDPPEISVIANGGSVTRTGFASFYPNTNTYNVVSGGYAEDGRGTVVLSDEIPTATDHAYTEYYGSHYQGWAKGFIGLTVERNTNPGVATATVKQGTYSSNGRPCLDVTFTKGTQKGTTTIVIGYTVTQ